MGHWRLSSIFCISFLVLCTIAQISLALPPTTSPPSTRPPPTSTTQDPFVYCWEVLGNQLSCQGAYQQSGFNTPCMNRCEYRNYGHFLNWCPYTPKLGCFCQSGYLYNSQGVCVPEALCKCNSLTREHYTSWNRYDEACTSNQSGQDSTTETRCFCKPCKFG